MIPYEKRRKSTPTAQTTVVISGPVCFLVFATPTFVSVSVISGVCYNLSRVIVTFQETVFRYIVYFLLLFEKLHKHRHCVVSEILVNHLPGFFLRPGMMYIERL